jgi:cobalt-zinc-cadmium efflux system protein
MPGGEGRLAVSAALNLVITLAEVIGGLLSGSLALLSDALHNFSDTTSLVIALVARRIGSRDATRRKTFGYRRIEIIAAFVNLVTLVLIAILLIKEAIERFLTPESIDGRIMMGVALVGLAANVATAVLLWRDSRTSLNLRSAFLHIVSDAASSVGVVAGGFLVIRYDLYIVDPIITVVIAGYILVMGFRMMRETTDILMNSAPGDLRVEDVIAAVEDLPEVLEMHHVHVWRVDEWEVALEGHVVIDDQDLAEMERIKTEVKTLLQERFSIGHSTLEFELIPCEDPGKNCYDAPEADTTGDRRPPA